MMLYPTIIPHFIQKVNRKSGFWAQNLKSIYKISYFYHVF